MAELAPGPEPVPIRCGPWTLVLDGADIRSLSAGGVELVSHLYPTVRDRDWNTVAPEVAVIDKVLRADRVRLRLDARNRAGDIDLCWHGLIELTADGGFSYQLDGTAGTDFDYCRIGFCLLFDAAVACGRPYRATTPDGDSHGSLPVAIAPQLIVDGIEQALTPACSAFELDLPEGTVRAELDGDLFELEDQRNWCDHSFKLYCTPMALGYPFRARAGQQFHQRVTVSTDISGPSVVAAVDRPVRVEPGAPQTRYPSIGIARSGVLDRPMSSAEATMIATLHPGHLKVDVDLGSPDWMPALELAISDARAIGCGLELAVHVRSDLTAGDVPAAFPARLAGVDVRRVVVLDADSHGTATTTPGQVHAVRDALRRVGVIAPVGGGTDGDFAELNRDRPQLPGPDFVAYTMNPQVHVFDDASLIRNLPGQASTVHTARTIAAGSAIVVHSVTLRQRFNPAAASLDSDGDGVGPDGLPSSVDPRQPSQFAAVWMLGSVAALAGAGVDSVTYFETVGWRGVLERSTGPLDPGPFRSAPGMVFPVFHLWRDIVEDVDPDTCVPMLDAAAGWAALALPVTGGRRLVVGNLRATRREFELAGLPADQARIRTLDTVTAELAAYRPGEFRGRWKRLPVTGGRASFDLGPYAYARVDLRDDAASGLDPR